MSEQLAFDMAEVGLDVPQGYKRTEVGVIPEDWKVEQLGLHAKFQTGPFGSALHKSDYLTNGVPVINPMQIINGKIVPTDSMAISSQIVEVVFG
jgi:type I restriction enzyme S subunit